MKPFLCVFVGFSLLVQSPLLAKESATEKASNQAPSHRLASQAETYEGEEYSKAFVNPSDTPELPNVLLIGDSISIGYTVEVRKRLFGKAEVFRIPENGRDSAYGVKGLDGWLGERKWDVIHFNWGLWDLCYRHFDSKVQGQRDKVNGKLTATLAQYEKNLQAIVEKLQATEAKLLWCATTPVPEFEAGRKAGAAQRYNVVAAKVMNAHEIVINDLHAHALLKLPEIQIRKGDVHFTKAGSIYLGEKVASEILSLLEDQQENQGKKSSRRASAKRGVSLASPKQTPPQ